MPPSVENYVSWTRINSCVFPILNELVHKPVTQSDTDYETISCLESTVTSINTIGSLGKHDGDG